MPDSPVGDNYEYLVEVPFSQMRHLFGDEIADKMAEKYITNETTDVRTDPKFELQAILLIGKIVGRANE